VRAVGLDVLCGFRCSCVSPLDMTKPAESGRSDLDGQGLLPAEGD
jgi:hypothetical protein